MAGRGESGDMAKKSEEVSADISCTAEWIIRDSPPDSMKPEETDKGRECWRNPATARN